MKNKETELSLWGVIKVFMIFYVGWYFLLPFMAFSFGLIPAFLGVEEGLIGFLFAAVLSMYFMYWVLNRRRSTPKTAWSTVDSGLKADIFVLVLSAFFISSLTAIALWHDTSFCDPKVGACDVVEGIDVFFPAFWLTLNGAALFLIYRILFINK